MTDPSPYSAAPAPPPQQQPTTNSPSAHHEVTVPTIPGFIDPNHTEISPSQLNIEVTNRRLPPSAAASTTSTLTPSVRPHSASLTADTSPAKRHKQQQALYYESPSPTKHNPNFLTRLSDDNSVASGDDSKGWEREDQRILFSQRLSKIKSKTHFTCN